MVEGIASPDEIEFPNPGYGDAAIESLETYKRLEADGTRPLFRISWTSTQSVVAPDSEISRALLDAEFEDGEEDAEEAVN